MKDTDKLDYEGMEDVPKKDNTTKRIVLSSLIIVVAVVIIGLSIAYAYYVNSVQNGGGNKNTTITSGVLEMSIATGEYISVDSATLINDTDVINSGAYTQFSIAMTENNSVDEATYTINLTISNISSNFSASSYVKWALYQCDDSNCENLNSVNDGNFSNQSAGDVMTLKESIPINDEETHYYRLYIWLSNDANNNQTDLLGGNLEAKVGFSATATD